MAVGDAGILGGNGNVSHQGHRQAGAHRHAVDGGDDRLVQVENVIDDVGGFLRVLRHDGGVVDGLLDHLKIAAGGEGFAGAGDDGHPRLRVGGDVPPDAAQLAVQPKVGGVEGFGTVHRQVDHAVGLLNEQVLVR